MLFIFSDQTQELVKKEGLRALAKTEVTADPGGHGLWVFAPGENREHAQVGALLVEFGGEKLQFHQ
ncbi:MAG: hypothetical protein Q7T49_03035 [bacterium]|nr:hypothetical protein [bacterium]